jgi:hypothetical protein
MSEKGPKPTVNSGMPDDPVEPSGPSYGVQPRTGGEDDMDATGKYLLLGVPQFAKDPISGNLMTSYLRLGASSSTWQQDPGGWLAEKIHLHGPPGAHLDPAQMADMAKTEGKAVLNLENISVGEERDPGRVFIDDDRDRVKGAAHGLDKAERVRQSKALHTRGGWRDHSDGNRISTTYGDKVEVVRGNYKMIVLGRQDDPTASSGWDASGQHIQDWGYTMPGASIRVEESTNYTDAAGNHVWHLQNTTEGVVQSSNFAGDFFTYQWGKKKWDFLGSEKPVEKGPNGFPRHNPHVLSKVWASRIESYTGSPLWPIGTDYPGISIREEKWALSTAALTNVAGLIDETTVAGSTRSNTTVNGDVNETTNVTGSVTSSTTVVANVTDTTSVTGTIKSTTTAGATNDITTVGAASSVSTTGVASDIAITGAALNVAVTGAQLDVSLTGIHVEASLTPLHLALEIAAAIEIFIGGKIDVQLGGLLEVRAGIKREIGSMDDRTKATIDDKAALYSIKAARIDLG